MDAYLKGRQLLVQDTHGTTHYKDHLYNHDDTDEADRTLALYGYIRTTPWHRHPVATWTATIQPATRQTPPQQNKTRPLTRYLRKLLGYQ